MVSIQQLYDIVITSNSGYPLDQNLYENVKGMSAAACAVRPGGTIILAAECRDGLPNHGEYANLLRHAALLVPCPDIEDCISELREKYGPAASICVMPEGPQTVPKPL